jgi:hypothetical protein
MNLNQAIAFSIGNKARAVNDNGQDVIVHQWFGYGAQASMFHVWHFAKESKGESDVTEERIEDELRSVYAIDANDSCWKSMN